MTSATGTRLYATTKRLDEFGELADHVAAGDFVFKRNGTGLVGKGTIATVDTSAATTLLSTMDIDDRVQRRGTGPLAVGALPFTGEGSLRIPARIIGVDDAGAWETTITGDEIPPPHAGASVPGKVMTRADWEVAVRRILAAIDDDIVEKVVLSRRIVVEHARAFDEAAIVRRLCDTRPDAWVFADHGFIGVTPELLVTRTGDRVRSLPVAGTVHAAQAASLLASEKLRREFQVVVDHVAGVLGRLPGPVTIADAAPIIAGNVAHLASEVRTEGPGCPPVTELVKALHPTPAVGGRPLGAALAMIADLEPSGRGRYAGPVGWVDARGDGSFAVALRCAELIGNRAVMFAGAGIVAGSDPAQEWEETESKFETMAGALGV